MQALRTLIRSGVDPKIAQATARLFNSPPGMSAAQKAFTVGGIGAQPTLDDVVCVATARMPVALDPAGAERVKRASPPPKSFQLEDATALQAISEQQQAASSKDVPLMSPTHTRAVLVTKLLQLMNGRSGVRLQVAEFIAALLNADILPQFAWAETDGQQQEGSKNAGPLVQLGHACYGQPEQPLASSLAAAGIVPPNLSPSERLVLQGGAAASAGVACLLVQGGKKLLGMTQAGAALSMEAIGMQTKVLDADLMEAQGYKGAAAVADELRSLLEGSKRVGLMKAGESESLGDAFNAVAQRLGSVADALASAYALVRPEVQSEALPPKANRPGNVVAPSLAPALLELGRALVGLAARDALTRARRVLQSAPAAAEQMEAAFAQVESSLQSAQQELLSVGSLLLQDPSCSPSLTAARAADAALRATLAAIALESLAGVAVLRMLEGPPAPAAPAADPTPQEANAGKGADNKKGGDKKKDKKGAGGVVLGKGTALVRAFVEGAAAGGPGSVLPVTPAEPPAVASLAADCLGPQSLAAVTAALDPLHSAVLDQMMVELRSCVEANQARRKPKVAKGARDFMPDQMAIREAAFNIITSVFKRHGAVSIDTPVFELRETLMGKYGEDSKLIYDLADQGGELLSLRYDLTVPFARYVAVNSVGNIKRYHIGKVYRRDQPQMTRGRFREFFQCDFDVAGAYATMVADSEVVKVLVEILQDLQLGEFEIKLNHRKLLDSMMEIAGVPPQKFRAICSAIDKLDKEPWEAVRSEMIEEKGLPAAVADRIGDFVVLRGEPMALLDKLSSPEHPFTQHPASRDAMEELRLLFKYLTAMNALRPVVLDLSLARGLDYYTGVIYEATLKGGNVGSIAAGGRYDTLVGMFSSKDVPAVGVSIGIERVFAIMEAKVRERAAAQGQPVRATETEVLVASIGNDMQMKRMEVANMLWEAGVKAEFGFKPNPKMGDQLNYALEQAIPFIVLFGDEELSAGCVKVKDMGEKTEDKVPLQDLTSDLNRRLQIRRAHSGLLPPK
uniref:Histidine--tRNA ligase, cytoplasmic n=1 Tax=Dunaliella tertiolecta TaxID=3047 RepID=A0A7S3QSI3_DUNTE